MVNIAMMPVHYYIRLNNNEQDIQWNLDGEQRKFLSDFQNELNRLVCIAGPVCFE